MQSITNNSVEHYKELALTKGDTTAYYQLSLDYMDSPLVHDKSANWLILRKIKERIVCKKG